MSDEVLFLQAFQSLTPANQTVIAALVFELANKDKQISEMARELMKRLDTAKTSGQEPDK